MEGITSPHAIEFKARSLTRKHMASYVRDLRIGLRLSQKDLAALCGMGEYTIARVEQEDSVIVNETLWTRLCAALNVPKERALRDILDEVASDLFYEGKTNV